MTTLPTDEAAPMAIALSTPCWWIDRNDCWETTHHATREDAEAHHADQIRSDYGWVLSVAGAFAIYPGVARQEPRRCYEVTCPACGAVGHHQTRFTACPAECGAEFKLEQIPVVDPCQTRLFDVPPTDEDQSNQALGLASRDTWFEADVDRVLAHIQARQCSHSDSPATGLHDMADERWRACIAALRTQGYPVITTVVVGGDRAGNETGYTLGT